MAGWAKATIKATYNDKPFRGMIAVNAEAVVHGILESTVAYAQANVAPGIGPGPHPHKFFRGKQHEDTGALQESIGIIAEPEWRGGRFSGSAGSLLSYGADLEFGFHGPSGQFYRYPWLQPAWEKALSETTQYMQTYRLGGRVWHMRKGGISKEW